MTPPPQDRDTVLASSEEIKAKFEELDMLTFLRQTCYPRNIPRDTKDPANRRYTAERGVTFIRKNDGESQAIMYYWMTLDGAEDYRVEQFTAPEGTFYTTADTITIKHPSNLPPTPQ